MPTNGKNVSQKQLYDTVMAVEVRLSTKIDSVLEAVHENRILTAATMATLTQTDEELCRRVTAIDGKDGAIEVLHGHVDNLRLSDKKWGGITATIAALGTLMAALLNRS